MHIVLTLDEHNIIKTHFYVKLQSKDKSIELYSIYFRSVKSYRKLKGIFDEFLTKQKFLSQLTSTTKQKLCDVYFEEMVHKSFVENNDKQYAIDYIDKLFQLGMKFYWTHLDNIMLTTSTDDQVYYQTPSSPYCELNMVLLKHGIEDPNCKLYCGDVDGGDAYHPLIAFATFENALQFELYHGFNLLYFLNLFNLWIDIKCSPHYGDTTCQHYSCSTFIKLMLKHINPTYEYSLADITATDINILIYANDFNEDEHIISKNKNLAILKLLRHMVFTYKKLDYIPRVSRKSTHLFNLLNEELPPIS